MRQKLQDEHLSDNDFELPRKETDSFRPEKGGNPEGCNWQIYSLQSVRPVVSTLTNIVSTFSDFLTVAIHTILYERKIYSPDLFISTRAYNHPVRQARHPMLCKWIQDAVEACSIQITEVWFS